MQKIKPDNKPENNETQNPHLEASSQQINEFEYNENNDEKQTNEDIKKITNSFRLKSEIEEVNNSKHKARIVLISQNRAEIFVQYQIQGFPNSKGPSFQSEIEHFITFVLILHEKYPWTAPFLLCTSQTMFPRLDDYRDFLEETIEGDWWPSFTALEIFDLLEKYVENKISTAVELIEPISTSMSSQITIPFPHQNIKTSFDLGKRICSLSVSHDLSSIYRNCKGVTLCRALYFNSQDAVIGKYEKVVLGLSWSNIVLFKKVVIVRKAKEKKVPANEENKRESKKYYLVKAWPIRGITKVESKKINRKIKVKATKDTQKIEEFEFCLKFQNGDKAYLKVPLDQEKLEKRAFEQTQKAEEKFRKEEEEKTHSFHKYSSARRAKSKSKSSKSSLSEKSQSENIMKEMIKAQSDSMNSRAVIMEEQESEVCSKISIKVSERSTQKDKNEKEGCKDKAEEEINESNCEKKYDKESELHIIKTSNAENKLKNVSEASEISQIEFDEKKESGSKIEEDNEREYEIKLKSNQKELQINKKVAKEKMFQNIFSNTQNQNEGEGLRIQSRKKYAKVSASINTSPSPKKDHHSDLLIYKESDQNESKIKQIHSSILGFPDTTECFEIAEEELLDNEKGLEIFHHIIQYIQLRECVLTGDNDFDTKVEIISKIIENSADLDEEIELQQYYQMKLKEIISNEYRKHELTTTFSEKFVFDI